jgi:hypothetical protein
VKELSELLKKAKIVDGEDYVVGYYYFDSLTETHNIIKVGRGWYDEIADMMIEIDPETVEATEY